MRDQGVPERRDVPRGKRDGGMHVPAGVRGRRLRDRWALVAGQAAAWWGQGRGRLQPTPLLVLPCRGERMRVQPLPERRALRRPG